MTCLVTRGLSRTLGAGCQRPQPVTCVSTETRTGAGKDRARGGRDQSREGPEQEGPEQEGPEQGSHGSSEESTFPPQDTRAGGRNEGGELGS